MQTDARSILCIVRRQGLWKLRRLNVRYLWLQDRTRNGDLEVHKVAEPKHLADLMTKHLAVATMLKDMAALNMGFPAGSASLAPSLNLVHRPVSSRDR